MSSVAAGAMSSGIVVLCSQAQGQAEGGGDPLLASLVFQRGFALTLIITVLTGVTWFLTYYYAKLCGATEEVSSMANQYTMTMLIGMPGVTPIVISVT